MTGKKPESARPQAMSDQLTAGADALRDLIKRVGEKGDADLEEVMGDAVIPDLRDYRAMAQMIDESMAANLTGATGDFREGFLRALTDLFSLVADDGLTRDWDPLPRTHIAFTAPAAMRAAIGTARA